MKLELIATATFGLEAVVKRELENLGYKILKSEDGKITFLGDERAVVRANLWLRSADRVQIKMAEFTVLEFEDLFQQMKAIPWEEWIPIDGKFVVNGSSVKSKLSSVPACQSVAEKAVVERLKEFYMVDYFTKTGAAYDIKITILKDRVTVTLDTTGPGLHKRGYRTHSVAGSGDDSAFILEQGQNPVRPVLRLRDHSDRGGTNCKKHRSRNKPKLCERRVGSDTGKPLERRAKGGI